MKTATHLNLKTLTFLITIIFIWGVNIKIFAVDPGVSALKSHSLSKPPLKDSIEWKTLLINEDVSIYYKEVKNNPCIGYQLRLVNHSDKNKKVVFGIASKLKDDCKNLYVNQNGFLFRKISLNPNETLMGSEAVPALLLPNSGNNLQLEEMIQNLVIQ